MCYITSWREAQWEELKAAGHTPTTARKLTVGTAGAHASPTPAPIFTHNLTILRYAKQSFARGSILVVLLNSPLMLRDKPTEWEHPT